MSSKDAGSTHGRGTIDLGTLIRIDPEHGRITLGRERMLLVSTDALGALRQELHDALGPALAAEVLYRFGSRCGQEEAARVRDELGIADPREALAMGPLLHAFEGVTRVLVQEVEFDPDRGTFHMTGEWEDSYEAEQHLRLFGISLNPVCWTLAGYASGYASTVFGKDLVCHESSCRGRGDPRCRWTVSPAPARPAEQLPEELRSAYRALEQRVLSQEALLRSLREAAGEAVYTVDAYGVITSWNRGASDAFGWAAERVLGRHERLLFPEDLVAKREPSRLGSLTRSGESVDQRGPRRGFDGAVFQVREVRRPIVGTDGSPVGATVVLHIAGAAGTMPDAAERKLQALLDNVPAGIALATADQQIVECNRGFREMLALAEDEDIGGRSCYELLAGQGKPCDDCPAHLVFEGGTPARCSPSFVRPDGRRVHYDLRSFPLRNAEGKVTHELKYVRDVTAETERSQELEEKRRLAALGEMAARVAHEVKNPLAGMRGALQVLLGRRQGHDPEKEVLAEVVAQIDRLDQTVRELLNFSRPAHPRAEPTDPNDVVDASLLLLRNSADLAGVEVRVERADMPPVPLDRQQVQQVLTNLVLNAAQALRPGDPRVVTVSVRDGAGGVEFAVRDQGPGIPPETRAKLFQPFFTTKARGTGLGLAISRKIAEAHRGRLDAECPPGGGTVFRLRIPRGTPLRVV